MGRHPTGKSTFHEDLEQLDDEIYVKKADVGISYAVRVTDGILRSGIFCNLADLDAAGIGQ